MRIAVAGATGLVGSQLTALARKEGHEVVEIARETGFDLTDPDTGGLEAALKGAEAVVEVTSFPAVDEAAATDFFTTVATNLGRAATAAGVRRSVVLSIVGIDESQDFPYYRAKLAHEKATRAAAPGALVLRATQFHEFARQCSGGTPTTASPGSWTCPPSPSTPPRSPGCCWTWPPATSTATSTWPARRSSGSSTSCERYAAHIGSDVTVEPDEAVASISGGSMLPPQRRRPHPRDRLADLAGRAGPITG